MTQRIPHPADALRGNVLRVVNGKGGHAAMPVEYINPLLIASEILLEINKYVFVIYLLNVPFIGLSKAILLKFIPWDGVHFLIFLPVLFACGLLGPIILKKYVFKKVPFLDKLTT